RQCTFTLTRLLLLKPLGNEVAFITIAVKMQSSKRTLRSNDILLPNTGGLLDTELDLSFSLQYPHFLKGAGGSNKLHVTLQRRKRYKNRAMLGYKTIATGIINMSEVLQRPVGRELELLGEEKERPEPVARIQVEALSTHPVHEEPCDARLKAQGQGPDAERSGDNTDDDDDSSSNEDASDSAPEEAGHTDALMRRRRSSQMRKRNIKQKFINLLKKFRVPDAEAFDAEHYPEGLEQELMHKNSRDLEDLLLDELDDLSDSGPEGDNLSLSSTPKPSLRPFFSSSTLVPLEAEKNNLWLVTSQSLRHSDESVQRGESDSAQPDSGSDSEDDAPASVRPSNAELTQALMVLSSVHSDRTTLAEMQNDLIARRRNTVQQTIDRFLEPLGMDSVKKTSLVRENEPKTSSSAPSKDLGTLLYLRSQDDPIPRHVYIVVSVVAAPAEATTADVAATVRGSAATTLLERLSEFANKMDLEPPGLNHMDCSKVESWASWFMILEIIKSAENRQGQRSETTQGALATVFILKSSCIYRLQKHVKDLSTGEVTKTVWEETADGSDDGSAPPPLCSIIYRALTYHDNTKANAAAAFAFVVSTCCHRKAILRNSSSVLSRTRLKTATVQQEGISTSARKSSGTVDLEEPLPGSSPPGGVAERESTTPPSSPSMSNTGLAPAGGCPGVPQGEAMDLQLDYWTLGPSARKGAEPSKLTLKAWFRSVWRLANTSEALGPSLSLSYVTKEKKQKIMRLGKKKERESEREARCQLVEGVHRLICSCRNLQAPLKVTVDSVEWTGVKFFQLSSQWQTHIKYFPVGLYMAPEHGQSH
ncbi:unnamed protein product, partial [Ixodes hexagonus]